MGASSKGSEYPPADYGRETLAGIASQLAFQAAERNTLYFKG